MIIKIFNDKFKTFQILKKINIPVPRYKLLNKNLNIKKILMNFGYPKKSVIIKSRYGIGGRGTYLLMGKDYKKFNWFGNFGRVLTGDNSYNPKGLYIWGCVGRGKSMLMDIFYDLAPIKKKKRTHFHNFMADVHNCINDLRKVSSIEDLPEHTAKVFAQNSLYQFVINELKTLYDHL